MQQPISKVSLSVRELVEFILASGSIDNRGGSADLYQRANEGSRLHRKLQRQAHERHGKAYRSEVVFSDERELDGILFSVYGRADGVLRENESAIIEEIKTTELPLSLLSGQPDTPGYNPLHWAQAKCYAFILSQQEKLDAVEVRLIYCQVETEELQQFTGSLCRAGAGKLLPGFAAPLPPLGAAARRLVCAAQSAGARSPLPFCLLPRGAATDGQR